MSTIPIANAAETLEWKLPSRGKVAMYSLIAAESAIFVIFVVAYLFYVGKSLSGPTPAILHLPIFLTICLLSSSLTIHLAGTSLVVAKMPRFNFWLILTIALGAIFLGGTVREWNHLIYTEGLTIRTNLFGTTYYSLVGLHAFHVTVGLLALTTVALFAIFRKVTPEHAERVEVLSLYWHFVDVVWVVVFSVVYVIGR
jgi:cytochrome c oxidase subunit 3/cytochrome o ubiquinol oxidase subunit 3